MNNRHLILGASKATIRAVGEELKSLRGTGESGRAEHGNTGSTPTNKTPMWVFKQIDECLQKYSWYDPTSKIRIATTEDVDGKTMLWQTFAAEYEAATKHISKSTFDNLLKEVLASEDVELRPSTTSHNDCQECKLTRGIVGNRHQKIEAAEVELRKQVDQDSVEAQRFKVEIEPMKFEKAAALALLDAHTRRDRLIRGYQLRVQAIATAAHAAPEVPCDFGPGEQQRCQSGQHRKL